MKSKMQEYAAHLDGMRSLAEQRAFQEGYDEGIKAAELTARFADEMCRRRRLLWFAYGAFTAAVLWFVVAMVRI